MGAADGILGIKGGLHGRGSEAVGGRRGTEKKWLKRRETWLVVLGVALHAVYMLSIFDIYFKTPVVHGMDPVVPRFSAPAKRLVLLIGNEYYDPCSLTLFKFTLQLIFQAHWKTEASNSTIRISVLVSNMVLSIVCLSKTRQQENEVCKILGELFPS